MKLIDSIVDWYLTKRTGKTKIRREYDAWYDTVVDRTALDPRKYFKGFKHIIELDRNKVYPEFHPFCGEIMSIEFKKFLYPQKPLGENIVCAWGTKGERPSVASGIIMSFYGDQELSILVATNSDEDALMLTMLYV